ncbi:hypothetical protein RvY_02083-2 [Ramazzottius varieornatus]|uniref:Uncharacterized protein n=1 Tax=Ramazzottius varieornatus TaxID=947166 RepID=A0A1D1UPG5_RAMVA|nr:hypothetical protein RvY_02083-2 [Ramazzottius varieornatus]
MIHSDKRWQLRRTYILYECGAWPLYVHGHNVLGGFRRNMSWAAQTFTRFPRNNIIPIWIRTIAIHTDPVARNRETFWTDHLNDTEVWIERIGEELTRAANKEGMFVWQSAYDMTLHEPAIYKDIAHPGTVLNRKILTLLFCSIAS